MAFTQRFQAGLGGTQFVNENFITANSVSSIDDTISIAGGSGTTTLPIFAEGGNSGDIKMIAFEFNQDVDKVQFYGSGNTLVFDAVNAMGLSELDRNQSYIFPGNAALSLNSIRDITNVRISLSTSLSSFPTRCKIAVASQVNSGDSISA